MLPNAFRTSNISTAKTPVTSRSPAIFSAAAEARAARSGCRPGAGAITSVQIPSVCTVSTTGQTAAWPIGLRATSTASSRTKSTRLSASRAEPVACARASQGAAAARSSASRTPFPSYPPVGVLSTTGQPAPAAKSASSSAVRTRAQAGHGMPASVSRARISALSWA